MTVGLDTNVLVRFLVKDDEQQLSLARTFIQSHCTISAPCHISTLVLSELVWVLESCYNLDRARIAEIIEYLLETTQLIIADQALVWQALKDFRASNADFPDHLIGRLNQAASCEFTATFDKKAGRQSLFKYIGQEPA